MEFLSHLSIGASLVFPAWLPPVALAPFIGSFLGVLIQRLPDHRPVAAARSACETCGHRLGPRDLIPLISFAWTRGRCRFCGAGIGLFAPAVESASMAVSIWAVLALPPDDVWPGCVLGWTLLTLAWIDARTMLLPDALTLPLLLSGLLFTVCRDPGQIAAHAIAALAGYLSLVLIAWTFRWLRGRDGLGMGDAKLFGALSAWLGLEQMPLTLLLAACLGLLAAAGMMLLGRQITGRTAIPFGPFLAAAAWLVWLHGDLIPE